MLGMKGTFWLITDRTELSSLSRLLMNYFQQYSEIFTHFLSYDLCLESIKTLSIWYNKRLLFTAINRFDWSLLLLFEWQKVNSLFWATFIEYIILFWLEFDVWIDVLGKQNGATCESFDKVWKPSLLSYFQHNSDASWRLDWPTSAHSTYSRMTTLKISLLDQ